MGAWYCCTGYVSIVSPLINYGLGHIKGSLSPWRYMYLVAGSVTILWALVIYFLMPPDPIRAKGFSNRERYIAVARMRVNNSGVRNTHYKMSQVVEALLDVRFWLMFAIAFLTMIANGPVSTFIPIIINSFGFSQLNSLLLTMPAGAVSGTIEILAPLAAYKIPGARTYIYIICEFGTIMAALLLWLLPRDQKGGLLFGVYFLASFGGGYAVQMGLQMANTAGYTKRSATSSGLFIGYCLGKACLDREWIASHANHERNRQLCRPANFQARGRASLCSRIHCGCCHVCSRCSAGFGVSLRLPLVQQETGQCWNGGGFRPRVRGRLHGQDQSPVPICGLRLL
jgi:hypothetical protein